ncbi:MAG: hypothetical protein NT106_09620 [Candidatus Sumerlaeota bacterium]|nr:hypothetical protein [Candidatus Sumerlaeota bacterium]
MVKESQSPTLLTPPERLRRLDQSYGDGAGIPDALIYHTGG